MPKVTEEYLEERRAQIVRDARSVFAEHGFDRATVALLEDGTGLSRGAIFHHFPTKLDLFLAVAEEDSRRYAQMIREEGVAAIVRVILDPDERIHASLPEIMRLYNSDPEFRERWAARGEPIDDALHEVVDAGQADGTIRDDLPQDALLRFLGIVADGVALQRAFQEDLHRFSDALVRLTQDAIARGRGAGS